RRRPGQHRGRPAPGPRHRAHHRAGQAPACGGRPENLFVKIPATEAGLPAITAAIGEGISVNVTLIFSVERYQDVMEAYLAGLELADAAGRDLSKIHSVASFFVSRVDSEIDTRLEQIGGEALALRGQAGVANAQAAF